MQVRAQQLCIVNAVGLSTWKWSGWVGQDGEKGRRGDNKIHTQQNPNTRSQRSRLGLRDFTTKTNETPPHALLYVKVWRRALPMVMRLASRCDLPSASLRNLSARAQS